MSRIFWLPLCLAMLLVGGCVTKPTTVHDEPERKMEAAGRMLEPIRITPETIVVDARPKFEYSLAHIPKSVSLTWSDFTEPEKGQRGVLQADLFAVARRLARYGITPSSQVVVIGRGKAGDGEEGRIAWMLAYLDVQNVQFADLNAFHVNMTNEIDESGFKAAPIWKPEPISSLNVTREEVLGAINKREIEKGVTSIIDVRSEKNYLGREGIGARQHIPNMGAVNIPWQEFFETNLRVSTAMGDRLRKVGIQPNQRIIVVDENGVSSAAVTMALRALGFEKAGNYAGGLTDLMSSR